MHDAARKEFEALPKNAQQGLAELMRRVRRQDPVQRRELGTYANGLKGLKYSEAHNEYRCYYSPEGEEGQVLVAVEVVQKKTESAHLGVAEQRIKEWRAEHRDRQRNRNRS
jgi:phage-related protein